VVVFSLSKKERKRKKRREKRKRKEKKRDTRRPTKQHGWPREFLDLPSQFSVGENRIDLNEKEEIRID